jgi:hypothetical protein
VPYMVSRHHRWFAGVSLSRGLLFEVLSSGSVIGGAPSPELSRRLLYGLGFVSLSLFSGFCQWRFLRRGGL